MTSFKFAIDARRLYDLNSRVDRGSASKFITAYPLDEADCLHLLEELSSKLKDHSGPDVFTDRPYKDSEVVHYRYGGISPKEVPTWDGRRQSVLLGPEGTIFVDERKPWFHLPPWIRKDPFAPQYRARNDTSIRQNSAYVLLNGVYQVTHFLHQATKGGVYIAKLVDHGESFVIKETRPFVMEEDDGRDGRDAMENEYRILQRLAGTNIGPRPIEMFRRWNRHYLVEEYIRAPTLQRWVASQGPLVLGGVASLRNLVLIWQSLTNALLRLQRIGIVCGDLSTRNVLISESSSINQDIAGFDVKIIDFESAYDMFSTKKPMVSLGTHGFLSPHRAAGNVPNEADDRYSLGAIMLSTMMPVHSFMQRHPETKHRVISEITTHLGLSSNIVELLFSLMSMDPSERLLLPDVAEVLEIERKSLRDVKNRRPVNAEDVSVRAKDLGINVGIFSEKWQHSLKKKSSRIVADLRQQEANWLGSDGFIFRTGPKAWETNSVCVGYGACGPLGVLASMKEEVALSTKNFILCADVSNLPPGLIVGSSGVACTLAEIDELDYAIALADMAKEHEMAREIHGLFYGSSGVGTMLLMIWRMTNNLSFLDHAVSIGRRIVACAISKNNGEHCYWPIPDGHIPIGLANGSSGIALFLLHLHLITGEEVFLRTCRAAIYHDLSYGVEFENEIMSFPNDTKNKEGIVTPYLYSGSAGVGSVLLRYIHASGDESRRDSLNNIIRDCSRVHAVFPGLFSGQAGIGRFLLDCYAFDKLDACLHRAAALWEALMCKRVEMEVSGGLCFAGDLDGYLNSDFADGSSGILSFGNALHDAVVGTDYFWPMYIFEIDAFLRDGV